MSIRCKEFIRSSELSPGKYLTHHLRFESTGEEYDLVIVTIGSQGILKDWKIYRQEEPGVIQIDDSILVVI